MTNIRVKLSHLAGAGLLLLSLVATGFAGYWKGAVNALQGPPAAVIAPETPAELHRQVKGAEVRAIETAQRSIELITQVGTMLLAAGALLVSFLGWIGFKSYHDIQDKLRQQLDTASVRAGEFDELAAKAREVSRQLDRTTSLAHLFAAHLTDAEAYTERANRAYKRMKNPKTDEPVESQEEFASDIWMATTSFREALDALGLGVNFEEISARLSELKDEHRQYNLKRIVCYIESRLALLAYYRNAFSEAHQHSKNSLSLNVRRIPDHLYNTACYFARSLDPNRALSPADGNSIRETLDEAFNAAVKWDDETLECLRKLNGLLNTAMEDPDLAGWRKSDDAATFLQAWQARAQIAAMTRVSPRTP